MGCCASARIKVGFGVAWRKNDGGEGDDGVDGGVDRMRERERGIHFQQFLHLFTIFFLIFFITYKIK